jgi:DnaJ-class molecular chaperone
MKKITCPGCKGSGRVSFDGEDSPCYQCGGSRTKGSGFFAQNKDKNGCGYIYVEDKGPCSNCGGKGFTTRQQVKSELAEYVARGGKPGPSGFVTVKDPCFSCGGTGYKK